MPNSLKSQTRSKHAKVHSQLSCHIQPDMKIPEWKRVFTNGKFKSNLTKFYTMLLAEIAHSIVDEGTSIIINGGLEETALKVNSNKVAYIKRL